MEGISPINFILQANTIKLVNPINLKIFDLKGSQDGRFTKKKGSNTLKDNNLKILRKSKLNKNKSGVLQF